jgi:hypothetical protein
VKDAYGDEVKTEAAVVDTRMSAWLKAPTNLTLLGSLQRAFVDLSTALMENPAPASRLADVQAFKNSCFTAMSAMAVIAENASRTLVRTDSVEVAIGRARLAVTCDRIVERFGAVPTTVSIGKDDSPSSYWEAAMYDVAPSTTGLVNERIRDNLRVLETSTKIKDIAKATDQLVADAKTVADNGGRGAMVLAEAMRSERVFPGGVYRSDQPDHRSNRGLAEDEIADLDVIINKRKAERGQPVDEDKAAKRRGPDGPG